MDDLGDLVALSVPAGSRVLAVAPEPALLERLVARNCRTWAVVADDSPALSARTLCEGVVVGDLDHLDVAEALPGLEVDVVVLMGTLAHVMVPAELLRRVGKVLVPEGRVVASVPNASHAGRRLRFWQGTGHDEEVGPGRTLLRAFAGDRIGQLLTENGLSVLDTLRVRRPFTGDTTPLPAAVSAFLESGEDADVDHYVLIASPAAGPHVAVPSVAEELQSRLHRAEQAVAERDAALGEMAEELKALQLDLAIKDDFAVELRGQVQTVEMTAAGLQAELGEARAEAARAQQELGRQTEELDDLRRRVGRGPVGSVREWIDRRLAGRR